MSITSFKLEFGSTVWIRFVQTRDAMLRAELPAITAKSYTRWAGRWCPVCGHARLSQDSDVFGKGIDHWFCSSCWASFKEQKVYSDRLELWLLPGQEFHRVDFPPLRFLPFSYPIQIR